MKLYYKPGACSLASHIVLNEVGQSFDLEKTDTETGKTESGEDFSQVNPNGYVPAVRIDSGQVITENAAILQFLGGLDPKSGLAPKEGLPAIRLRELLSFLSSELHKAFSPFFSGTKLNAEDRARAEAMVAKRVVHLERQLADGRTFLLGDDFTVADAYAFVVLNWANFVGIKLTQWPQVKDFTARVLQRPSVVKAMKAEGLI